jgi:hypothetical protein
LGSGENRTRADKRRSKPPNRTAPNLAPFEILLPGGLLAPCRSIASSVRNRCREGQPPHVVLV